MRLLILRATAAVATFIGFFLAIAGALVFLALATSVATAPLNTEGQLFALASFGAVPVGVLVFLYALDWWDDLEIDAFFAALD